MTPSSYRAWCGVIGRVLPKPAALMREALSETLPVRIATGEIRAYLPVSSDEGMAAGSGTSLTAVRRIYQRGALNIAILYKHQSCELIARLAKFELFYWFRMQKYNLVSQRLCHNWLNYAIVFKWCQKRQILQHFSRNMHKFCTFLCTTDVRYIAVEFNMTMNTIR